MLVSKSMMSRNQRRLTKPLPPCTEMARLQAEVDRLRRELASFDPSFFEELEDLKYNYDLAVKKNRLLEEQLRSLGDQSGAKAELGRSPVR